MQGNRVMKRNRLAFLESWRFILPALVAVLIALALESGVLS